MKLRCCELKVLLGTPIVFVSWKRENIQRIPGINYFRFFCPFFSLITSFVRGWMSELLYSFVDVPEFCSVIGVQLNGIMLILSSEINNVILHDLFLEGAT